MTWATRLDFGSTWTISAVILGENRSEGCGNLVTVWTIDWLGPAEGSPVTQIGKVAVTSPVQANSYMSLCKSEGRI